MYSFDAKIRTRYSETDKMGVIYHANYITYYELARSQMLQSLGDYSYRQMEEEGIMMPVVEIQCRYLKPAYYDEELTIRTTINELPSSRMTFHYEVYNVSGELLNTGMACLTFINSITRRPCRPPKKLLEIMRPYFK